MNAEHFSEDIQEFLTCLHEHQVRYLIVGGEAVIYYGYARLTGDIDIFFESSPENCDKLFQALLHFWSGDIPGINATSELRQAGVIIQFGVPPNRIDLINEIDGVSFQEAWQNRETTRLVRSGASSRPAIEVNIIGLEELIKNKQRVKRHKDLEDLEYLKRIAEQRRGDRAAP